MQQRVSFFYQIHNKARLSRKRIDSWKGIHRGGSDLKWCLQAYAVLRASTRDGCFSFFLLQFRFILRTLSGLNTTFIVAGLPTVKHRSPSKEGHRH